MKHFNVVERRHRFADVVTEGDAVVDDAPIFGVDGGNVDAVSFEQRLDDFHRVRLDGVHQRTHSDAVDKINVAADVDQQSDVFDVATNDVHNQRRAALAPSGCAEVESPPEVIEDRELGETIEVGAAVDQSFCSFIIWQRRVGEEDRQRRLSESVEIVNIVDGRSFDKFLKEHFVTSLA